MLSGSEEFLDIEIKDEKIIVEIKDLSKTISLTLGNRKLFFGLLNKSKDVGYEVTLKWRFFEVSFSRK